MSQGLDRVYKTLNLGEIKVQYFSRSKEPLAVSHELALDTHDGTGGDLWEQPVLALVTALKELAESHSLGAIIELGSGLGVCGIVAAKLGAQPVWLTDDDPFTLEILRENTKLNQISQIEVCSYSWGRDWVQEPRQFQLIIGSDLLYTSSQAPKLFSSVNQLLVMQGEFILSHEVRFSHFLGEEGLPETSKEDEVLESFLRLCDESHWNIQLRKWTNGGFSRIPNTCNVIEGDTIMLTIRRMENHKRPLEPGYTTACESQSGKKPKTPALTGNQNEVSFG